MRLTGSDGKWPSLRIPQWKFVIGLRTNSAGMQEHILVTRKIPQTLSASKAPSYRPDMRES
jgi:hypothetical protein